MAGKPSLVVISGPTASGKSRLAIEAAKYLEAKGICVEIISADSAQVYRQMDIGTDKMPEHEWEGIPHHMIDVVDPDDEFSAADFKNLAGDLISRLHEEGRAAILVGGTGFYIRALLQGLFKGPTRDEGLRREYKMLADSKGPGFLHERLKEIDIESANRIHPNDIKRLIRAFEVYELTGRTLTEHFREHEKDSPYDVLMLGLDLERKELYRRIESRVDEMMERGFLEEVRRLRERGFGPWLKSQQILGYRQLHLHLDGKLGLDEAVEDAKKKTRHYARRQLVWMRSEKQTRWRHAERDKDKIKEEALNFLKKAKIDI